MRHVHKIIIFSLIGLMSFMLMGLMGCKNLRHPTPIPGIALPFKQIAENSIGYNSDVMLPKDMFEIVVANSPTDAQELIKIFHPWENKNSSLDSKLLNVSWNEAFVLAIFRRPGPSDCDKFDVREIKNSNGQILVILNTMEKGYPCKDYETHRYQILEVKRIPSSLAPKRKDIQIIPLPYEKNTPTPWK